MRSAPPAAVCAPPPVVRDDADPSAADVPAWRSVPAPAPLMRAMGAPACDLGAPDVEKPPRRMPPTTGARGGRAPDVRIGTAARPTFPVAATDEPPNRTGSESAEAMMRLRTAAVGGRAPAVRLAGMRCAFSGRALRSNAELEPGAAICFRVSRVPLRFVMRSLGSTKRETLASNGFR